MAYYREKLRRKSRKNSLALREVQFLYKYYIVNRKLPASFGHFSKIPEECFEILKITKFINYENSAIILNSRTVTDRDLDILLFKP